MVAEDDVGAGEVLGGCVVDGREPDRQCRACGHSWRFRPTSLQWPDPSAHLDGQTVDVGGTVGRVVIEATSRDDVWANFDLVVEQELPRLACVAFPSVFTALDVALEPGLGVRLRGRITRNPSGAPELHVTEWLPATG